MIRRYVTFALFVVTSIGCLVLGHREGYRLAGEQMEYDVEHLRETVDNCLMRERLGIR